MVDDGWWSSINILNNILRNSAQLPIYSAECDSLPSSSLRSVGRFVVVGLVHSTQEPDGIVGFGQLAVGFVVVVLHQEGL